MKTIKDLLSSLNDAAINLDSQAVQSISEEIKQTIDKTKANGIEHYRESLNNALTTYDDSRTAYLCNQLIKDLRNPDFEHIHAGVIRVLSLLIRHRKYELVVKVAETAMQSFTCEPAVTKLYAQALIELKILIPAIELLKNLEIQCLEDSSESELVETRGLLGRAYKQMYMDAAEHRNISPTAQNAINKSIDFYLNEYKTCPCDRTWHGINAVALYRRAVKDGVLLSTDDSHLVLSDLINTMEKKISRNSYNADSKEGESLDKWTMATYAEALIANGQPVEALQWFSTYIGESTEDNRADAFQIASTLRQLEEVWQLSHEKPVEKNILDVLNAALLSREGGSIRINSPATELTTVNNILQDGEFEKVFGHDRYKNLVWYRTGLECASTVCRIEDRVGSGIGTGFLVHGSSLGIEQLDQWMLLTNAHVVSNDGREQQSSPRALAPEDVKIRFEAGDVNAESLYITGVIATSGRFNLDFTLLSVAGVSGNPVNLPISNTLPNINDRERLYIIGHPKGGGLSFSLHDNLLLDYETPKIHYRSPTEGGSSGSPVFNDRWELIGLHHLGSNALKRLNGKDGHYEANEGISIRSVISEIESQLAP